MSGTPFGRRDSGQWCATVGHVPWRKWFIGERPENPTKRQVRAALGQAVAWTLISAGIVGSGFLGSDSWIVWTYVPLWGFIVGIHWVRYYVLRQDRHWPIDVSSVASLSVCAGSARATPLLHAPHRLRAGHQIPSAGLVARF
jgi:hypothetical protein